jgi:hypothetical protein
MKGKLEHKYPYLIADAASVPTGKSGIFAYSPDFSNAKPYNNCLKNCSIVMTGSRRRDYLAAETLTRRRNRGETWHHVFPQSRQLYHDANGYHCEMQLVSTQLHQKCCPHLGAVSLYPLPYRFINAATPEVWQKFDGPMEDPPDLAKALWNLDRWHYLYVTFRDLEAIYIDMIYNQMESVLAVQNLVEYPWFNEMIFNLGWYPLGEDACGNILFWRQTGKIYDGIFIYALHEIESDKGCAVATLGCSCGSNWDSFVFTYVR